jgi:hypothetical protein
MSRRSDRLPASRENILSIARDRQDIAGNIGSGWGIPPAVTRIFGSLIAAAYNALEVAKNETTRTPVITAHYKEVFDALTIATRDMKWKKGRGPRGPLISAFIP